MVVQSHSTHSTACGLLMTDICSSVQEALFLLLSGECTGHLCEEKTPHFPDTVRVYGSTMLPVWFLYVFCVTGSECSFGCLTRPLINRRKRTYTCKTIAAWQCYLFFISTSIWWHCLKFNAQTNTGIRMEPEKDTGGNRTGASTCVKWIQNIFSVTNVFTL